MCGMKRDMGGAAAILQAFCTMVKLGVTDVDLTAILCLAENAVGMAPLPVMQGIEMQACLPAPRLIPQAPSQPARTTSTCCTRARRSRLTTQMQVGLPRIVPRLSIMEDGVLTLRRVPFRTSPLPPGCRGQAGAC